MPAPQAESSSSESARASALARRADDELVRDLFAVVPEATIAKYMSTRTLMNEVAKRCRVEPRLTIARS
eukprot:6609414-Alexandrium_andersonii.AAC.1